MKIKIDKDAFIPTRAHMTDAGLDLYSPVDVCVGARASATIDTGVHISLPIYSAGILISKSGLNVNHGITSTGLIDAGYTGSIAVKLYNNSDEAYVVRRGNKISQLVIVPFIVTSLDIVDELDETERGDNGFGSTGR